MAVIGGRNVGTNDLVVISTGIVMFIVSFFPWYGVSAKGFPGATASAWNSGFGAWFSVLLVLAVAGAAAARIFAGRGIPSIAGGAVSPNVLTAGVSVIAAIIILLRWVTYPDAGGLSGISAGAKFGTYLGLIIAIVQAVYGYLAIVSAGERLPWQKRTV